MATQVLLAHTGQRLQVDTTQFSSLDEFKAWVSRQSSIPVPQMVALSPQGRSVKLQLLHSEKEIYIYDHRVTQATSPNSPTSHIESPVPKRYVPSEAPNALNSKSSIAAWQALFRDRRSWALRVVDDCARMTQAAQERYGEMDVIIKCLDAAITNLEHSVKQIEPKYNELEKWVRPALEEHEQLAKQWEQYLALAKGVHISPAMVKFMTGQDVRKGGPATLEDLVDIDTARKFGRAAQTALRKFGGKAADLDKSAGRMHRELEQLSQGFEQLLSRSVLSHHSDAPQLYEDIEALAKKIDTDYQTSLEYSDTDRDILQASRMASSHTTRLIPNLHKRAVEMDGMLQYATQARNSIAADSAEFMRTITQITTLHSSVKTQMNSINSAEEELNTFDYLRLIHQLPYMYASFVAEAIRRREWTDKIKTDSSTLANEMALFQDEESKRRRKWQKMVGSTYGPDGVEANVMGLEVNLLGDEDPWPVMTKRDLDEFLDNLQRQNADTAIIDDVAKLAGELMNPTKQQNKRMKAFKNGSVHEAALGRSGLMIRGDDDLIRSLQEHNLKLEGRLKTSDSRVRRLEDLLHRHNQSSRPSLVFPPPSQQLLSQPDSILSVGSPRPGDDRRKSADGTDLFLHRIKQLEDELSVEREKSAIFEKDLNARTTQHDNIRGQMEEANSTKKDLLENMEALKREFMEERKSLEDEIKALRARLEDTEDEIEHFGESRENEKANYDERVRALELALERTAKERKDETQKAQGQVEFLRTEARLQREQNEVLAKQLQTAQDEAKGLAKSLDGANEAVDVQLGALRDLHVQLSPTEVVPEELAELTEGLVARATELLTQLSTTESDAALLRSDLEREQGMTKELRSEISSTREALAINELGTVHLRESMAEQKARVAALEGEIEGGRKQLDELRAKIADGETGSETLRKRLDEEEQRIVTLTEELASKQSQVGGLEEELRLYKERLQDAQSKLGALTERFDARTEHTKDLTQRLYSQNDRLCKLLERLGFAVTRKGSSMTILKIPRAERSSQNPNDSSDPGSSIRRSMTLASKALADSADLELLYWMNAADADAESEKYVAFMEALGHFDMDVFSDTVYRRVKDVEHLARKLQRNAGAYREKAHAMQKEAHDKIAFKHFKEGDLALFLPTRNQSAGAWAAFNVGFPHYFLREQDAHRLRSREFLLARISRIQDRVVDLSKSMHQPADSDSMNDEENDNPFQLSDGLRWYLLDAHEDKPGAPATPGPSKTTVAANNVEAVADIQTHARATKGKDRLSVHSMEGVSKTLSKSLESRRSSSGSKKASPFTIAGGKLLLNSNALASETNSLRAAPTGGPETPVATSPPHGGALLSPSTVRPQPIDSTVFDAGSSTSPQKPATEAEASTTPKPSSAMPPPPLPAAAADGPKTPEARPPRPLQRELSNASVDSPTRRSVVWDSLWSLDLSYESGGKKRRAEGS